MTAECIYVEKERKCAVILVRFKNGIVTYLVNFTYLVKVTYLVNSYLSGHFFDQISNFDKIGYYIWKMR